MAWKQNKDTLTLLEQENSKHFDSSFHLLFLKQFKLIFVVICSFIQCISMAIVLKMQTIVGFSQQITTCQSRDFL